MNELRAYVLGPRYPTGSEWLEALISTGLKYPVPRLTGGADLWDGTVTVKSLGYALDRYYRMVDAYAEMSEAERAAVWTDDDLAPMRRAVRR